MTDQEISNLLDEAHRADMAEFDRCPQCGDYVPENCALRGCSTDA